MEPIEWDEFFRIFDENNLAFLYQEQTKDGGESRFSKFVDRDSVDDETEQSAVAQEQISKDILLAAIDLLLLCLCSTTHSANSCLCVSTQPRAGSTRNVPAIAR